MSFFNANKCTIMLYCDKWCNVWYGTNVYTSCERKQWKCLKFHIECVYYINILAAAAAAAKWDRGHCECFKRNQIYARPVRSDSPTHTDYRVIENSSASTTIATINERGKSQSDFWLYKKFTNRVTAKMTVVVGGHTNTKKPESNVHTCTRIRRATELLYSSMLSCAPTFIKMYRYCVRLIFYSLPTVAVNCLSTEFIIYLSLYAGCNEI